MICLEVGHTTYEKRYFKISLFHFHVIMSYGIIFWGNSGDSKRVFNIKKKIIRVMTRVEKTVS
jgi:hypothetical protein